MLTAMPPLLLELWREQHPRGQEQTRLDFQRLRPTLKTAWLFGVGEIAVA